MACKGSSSSAEYGHRSNQVLVPTPAPLRLDAHRQDDVVDPLTIGYTILTTGQDIRIAKDDPAVTSKVGWLPPSAVGEMAYFTLAMVRPNRQNIHMRHALPLAAFAMNTGEALLVTATRRPIKPEEKEQLRVARQRLAHVRPAVEAAMPDAAEPRALLHGQNDSGGRHVFDFAF
jgi:hypothetical protein